MQTYTRTLRQDGRPIGSSRVVHSSRDHRGTCLNRWSVQIMRARRASGLHLNLWISVGPVRIQIGSR